MNTQAYPVLAVVPEESEGKAALLNWAVDIEQELWNVLGADKTATRSAPLYKMLMFVKAAGHVKKQDEKARKAFWDLIFDVAGLPGPYDTNIRELTGSWWGEYAYRAAFELLHFTLETKFADMRSASYAIANDVTNLRWGRMVVAAYGDKALDGCYWLHANGEILMGQYEFDGKREDVQLLPLVEFTPGTAVRIMDPTHIYNGRYGFIREAVPGSKTWFSFVFRRGSATEEPTVVQAGQIRKAIG